MNFKGDSSSSERPVNIMEMLLNDSENYDDLTDNKTVPKKSIAPFRDLTNQRTNNYQNTDSRTQNSSNQNQETRHRSELQFGEQCGRLWASNLRYDVTDEDLCTLFGEFGQLRRAAVNFDPDGSSRGTALIVFENRADALKAFQALNGKQLDGRIVLLRIVEKRGRPNTVRYFMGNDNINVSKADSKSVDENHLNNTDQNCDVQSRKRAKTYYD